MITLKLNESRVRELLVRKRRTIALVYVAVRQPPAAPPALIFNAPANSGLLPLL